jgi:hypothetical protein
MPIISVLLCAIIFLAACAPQTVTTVPTPPTIQRLSEPTVQSPGAPITQPPRTPTISLSDQQTSALFDAHLHYSRDAWSQYSVPAILATLDRAGIQRALVSSTPNEGTLRLYEAAPGRIVPEVRPYRVSEDVPRWYTEPGIVEYIESELKRPNIPYRGLGEFHIYGDEPKAPFVKRVVDLAVERNLILHAHSDDAAIANLLALNPRVKILWAHTGMSTPISTVEKILERYPNLYAELALRSDVSAGGKLDPGWRGLLLKHPDRFLYGTDTWIPSRWEDVVPGAAMARGWMAELPRDVAERIAWRNFEMLYGK